MEWIRQESKISINDLSFPIVGRKLDNSSNRQNIIAFR